MTTMLMAALMALTVTVKPGDDLCAVRDRVRAERKAGERAEVVFADGVYSLTNRLVLTAADSGTTWRAAHGGKATLIGGHAFSGADFTRPCDERVLKRIPAAARGKVLAWKVPANLVTNFAPRCWTGGGYGWWNRNDWVWEPHVRLDTANGAYPRQPVLSVGFRMMMPAMWPNAPDRLYVLAASNIVRKAARKTKDAPAVNGLVRAGQDRVKTWDFTGADIWAAGFCSGCAYATSNVAVLGYDAEHDAVEFDGGLGVNARIRYMNVMEELDAPGEWCFADGTLYLYPPEGFGPATFCALGVEKEPFFVLEGEDISIEGFAFTAKHSHPAVVMRGRRNTLAGSTFAAIGYDTVALCGRENRVTGCAFRDIPATPVIVTGGDPKAGICGSNAVENCLFENYAFLKSSWSRGGVGLRGGLCNRVSHCVFHDCIESAVEAGGFGHVIEYCRAYDICREFWDDAVMYTDGGSYGIVFRFNDLSGSPGQSHALYFDDQSSGQKAYGNVLRNFGYFGVFIGGGRDILVSNNVITAGWGGTRIDNRGLFWPAWKDVEQCHSNLVKRLDYEKGPLARMFPDFAKWHADGKMMFAPLNNRWINNLFLDLSGFPTQAQISRNRTIPDEKFELRGNLFVRTEGLKPGAYDFSGDTSRLPTNEYSTSSTKFEPIAHRPVRLLDGTPENPIDLGFVDVPKAVFDPGVYMMPAQGWVDTDVLPQLIRDGLSAKGWRKGDFNLKPDARLLREIPGWQPIPWDEIGVIGKPFGG